MKFIAIGLLALLALTTTSSTETISGWGPFLMMLLLTTLGTGWVLAGEADAAQSSGNRKKAK